MEDTVMAQEPHPDDPYRVRNPSRPYLDDDLRREAGLDRDLLADPELPEGPAGGSKIALFALALALVLGAAFYGLNNSSLHRSDTSSTAQNTAPATAPSTMPRTAQGAAPATAQGAAPATAQGAAPTSPPAVPPGIRDVTPRANTGPGMTTGAAPSQTPPPPDSPGAADNMPARK
jgi:hypothetical protein